MGLEDRMGADYLVLNQIFQLSKVIDDQTFRLSLVLKSRECVTRVTRQFIVAPLMPSEDFHAVASLGVSVSERRWNTSTQDVFAF